jgi:hypothetical protein
MQTENKQHGTTGSSHGPRAGGFYARQAATSSLPAPCLNTAAQDHDIPDACGLHLGGGLRRAFVSQAHKHERLVTAGKLAAIRLQFVERDIARAIDMTERPVEFIGTAHIDYQRRGATRQSLL